MDSRGRITLPKAMRDALGIQPGDDFDFRLVDKRVLVIRRSDKLTFEMILAAEQQP